MINANAHKFGSTQNSRISWSKQQADAEYLELENFQAADASLCTNLCEVVTM